MRTDLDPIALAIFLFFFALVTVMGFIAARWRRPETLAKIDEWGLGGRSFGTWITWFLIGGDFYTAYTVIAVPALVYAVGAYGFFALPYFADARAKSAIDGNPDIQRIAPKDRDLPTLRFSHFQLGSAE